MISRRTFAKAVGLGAAALSLGGAGTAAAATTSTASVPLVTIPPITPGTHSSFPQIKQIRAGELNTGYADLGPADGPVVICLHGFPYTNLSYVDVAPALADAGYRVLVPYFRGHGSTTFLSRRAPRLAEQSAFALDIIALMDALHIDKAVLAGYDWGSRTADIIAALWPQRCKALVSVTGYLITSLETNLSPIAPAAEHDWWYQYYFATERGVQGLTQYTDQLARLIWGMNSPTWNFTDAEFAAAAASFTNPDYVPIVIYNYRWRLSLVPTNPRYAELEARLAKAPTIGVPTITIDPEVDPFTPPGDGANYRAKFTGKYEHRDFAGIGHNVPQEAPTAFAQAVVDADHL